MQLIDSACAYLAKVDAVDLLEDWKKLPGSNDPNNLPIFVFIVATAIIFGVFILVGCRADKKKTKTMSVLDQRMRLLGGDVTQELIKQARSNPVRTFKQKIYYNWWKYWICDKVNSVYRTTICIRKCCCSCHSAHILLQVSCAHSLMNSLTESQDTCAHASLSYA